MPNVYFLTLAYGAVLLSSCSGRVFEFTQKDGQIVNAELESPMCGYPSCPTGKEGYLNVHLVPHTHDDVGWLKTVDQYYYGSHNEIANAGVQYILDSVIPELEKDATRRFIYVEMAFFSRWWDEQSAVMKKRVKALVNQGRLEFILGGWSMNDEASTHYNAIIDQHTEGFRFLKNQFGSCARPRIGWQIDPFGHSREQASLFAQFGFDGYFFGRLDYQDKKVREKNKTMEQVWMASPSLGLQASMFTGVNYNGYGCPDGFDYNYGSSSPPIMDDPNLHDFNVDERVNTFIKYARKQTKSYNTNHIMMTMGGDFQYADAHVNFKNLDKLITYVNAKREKSKVNVFYSTPSCYTLALNKAQKKYTVKTDDFFPYASSPHAFWTGYFTSRPTLKGFVRETNNFLQICKQLEVLGKQEHVSDKVKVLRRAMGVAQHHDAVSGTEKQAVAYDYAQRLSNGIHKCQEVISAGLGSAMTSSGDASPKLEFCPLLNVSRCDVTEANSQFSVVLYNPIGRPTSHYVRLPVYRTGLCVKSPQGAAIPSQYVPLSDVTRSLPEHKGSSARWDLVFKASVPALGYATYHVMEAKSAEEQASAEMSQIEVPADDDNDDVTMINSEFVELELNSKTGEPLSYTDVKTEKQLHLNHTLLWYKSAAGEDHKQVSGAYVFRPNNTQRHAVTNKTTVTFIKGGVVSEARRRFGDWASAVYRLYGDSAHLEVEWTVGPIPYKDKVGREVISLFHSEDIKSGDTFYTDSNGREVLQRRVNYRPTWKLNQTEPVAGNYYPVNSRIYIEDKKSGDNLNILTDRSQGGASLHSGEMELMVHRRMYLDDGYGVGEPLNETGISGRGLVARGKHYVMVKTAHVQPRDLALRLYMAPLVMFVGGKVDPVTMKPQDTFLKTNLPPNVHLLTLEKWEDDTYLIRLEHFYAKQDDPVLSKTVAVNLKTLFSAFSTELVSELTLGANVQLKDAKRLQWKLKNGGTTPTDMASSFTPVDATTNVTLKPMQIRTFLVRLKPSTMEMTHSVAQQNVL